MFNLMKGGRQNVSTNLARSVTVEFLILTVQMTMLLKLIFEMKILCSDVMDLHVLIVLLQYFLSTHNVKSEDSIRVVILEHVW